MKWTEALDIGERDTITLVGAPGRIAAMFAIAHELREHHKVITTATVRFPVPSPEQCEACVADAETEVAYRDTIERIKYFPHVHTGIGGSGGFVTTRVSNIGRNYRPSSDGLITALHQNPSMPYVLICGAEATNGMPPVSPTTTCLVFVVDAAALASAPATAIPELPAPASAAAPRIYVLVTIAAGTSEFDPEDLRTTLAHEAARRPAEARWQGVVFGRMIEDGDMSVIS